MPTPRSAPRRAYHGYDTVRDSAFSQWLGATLHAGFDATLDSAVPPGLLRLIAEQAAPRR
jgi:hypothetical protein